MARGHHRTGSPHGPDALDWYEAAHAIEQEFSCSIALSAYPGGAGQHSISVRAWREVNDVKLGLVHEQLPFPNTKFQGFWPSAYLLLHRVSEALHNAAYTPARKHPDKGRT